MSELPVENEQQQIGTKKRKSDQTNLFDNNFKQKQQIISTQVQSEKEDAFKKKREEKIQRGTQRALRAEQLRTSIANKRSDIEYIKTISELVNNVNRSFDSETNELIEKWNVLQQWVSEERPDPTIQLEQQWNKKNISERQCGRLCPQMLLNALKKSIDDDGCV